MLVALLFFFGLLIVVTLVTGIVLYFTLKPTQDEIKEGLKKIKENESLRAKKIAQSKHQESKSAEVEIKTIINKKPNSGNYDFDKWKSETITYLKKCLTVSDLLITKEPSKILYGDLLQTLEWRYKRLMILLNDNYKCKDCGTRSVYNHVHHNYYIKGKLPWNVYDDCLVTLCRDCHSSRHENQKIPVYIYEDGLPVAVDSYENPNCDRCGGIGYIPQYWYHHSGICFKCSGDLISFTVFEKELNAKLKYLNTTDINCKLLKDKAEYNLNNLMYSELIVKLPNYEDYEIISSGDS